MPVVPGTARSPLMEGPPSQQDLLMAAASLGQIPIQEPEKAPRPVSLKQPPKPKAKRR